MHSIRVLIIYGMHCAGRQKKKILKEPIEWKVGDRLARE